MKKNDTVAIITIGTIVDNQQAIIADDIEAKTALAKCLKSGWIIVSAIPTHTNTQACITYILKKQELL